MAHNGTHPHTEEDLTAPQARALAALLKASDTRAAAKAARVPERTLWTWLSLPTFKDTLNEAMGQVIAAAIFDLANLASDAVETLRAVMTDKETVPATRVRAANVVLARLIDLRDFKDFDERLTEIEYALHLKDR